MPEGGMREGETTEVQEIEIDLLLEAIFRRYGYDFRGYARASVRRKVLAIAKRLGVAPLSELIPRLLHDQALFGTIVGAFSTPVTEMFRDPPFFRFIRESVVPFLKTYPFVRVWLAGCATGEEAYSVAILLQEEGLFDRTTLFATDFVDASLSQAREGIYPLRTMKTNIMNYQQAGGKQLFSDYYHADYDSVIMDSKLKEHITFANHNLVTDGVFSEMHLILCRNVLIYFKHTLQERVLNLFHESLLHGGFLALGSKESLRHHELNNKFRELEPTWKVYRKID